MGLTYYVAIGWSSVIYLHITLKIALDSNTPICVVEARKLDAVTKHKRVSMRL